MLLTSFVKRQQDIVYISLFYMKFNLSIHAVVYYKQTKHEYLFLYKSNFSIVYLF